MTKQRGFTLIEVLLYTMIAGAILLAAVRLATTALTIRSKVRSTLVLEENVRFASGRITNLVLEATGITTPVIGTPSSTLALTTSVVTTTPSTFRLTNGALTLAQGTGTAMAITSNEVKVTRLLFTRVSSTTPIVRIELTATLTNASVSFPSLSVTTTADVRK
jgi:Tfp pilus assembly protein PilW